MIVLYTKNTMCFYNQKQLVDKLYIMWINCAISAYNCGIYSLDKGF